MSESEQRENGDGAPPIRLVALTGFMGSGKTTIGRELASLLGWEFADLDEMIEGVEHTSIRELFRQRGEEEFRKIEHRTLATLLAHFSEPTVLALGGGVFVQPNNFELLRQNWIRTVFLEATVDEMLRRCSVGDGQDAENVRPLAVDRAGFEQLYEQRLPWYRRADVTVRGDAITAAEVAKVIATTLHLRKGR